MTTSPPRHEVNKTLLAIAVSAILTVACGDSDDGAIPSSGDTSATPSAGPNPMAPLEPGGGPETPVDATSGPGAGPTAPAEPGSAPERPADAAPGAIDPGAELEVRDSFELNRRPEAIDTVEFVSGLFDFFGRPGSDDRALPAERPYFEQRESSTPFSRDPFVPGTTESVLIDIDAGGTGTYRDVSTYQDDDTRQRDTRIATRVHDGSSVTWMGEYAYTDSSSLRRERYEFTTETRAIGERIFLQSGQIAREGSPSTTADQRPIDIAYELTSVGPIGSLRECEPMSGTLVYDSGFTAADGFTFVPTETRIEKLEGEDFWTVRETMASDGSLRDAYLVASIGLGPICDFPEL